MPFYAHPTEEISPGDIFPEIPFSVTLAPTKVARQSGWNPPAGRGPAEFRRIFTLPRDQAELANSQLRTQQGEDVLANMRFGKALFVTWGSEVESTLRRVGEHAGRVGKRSWLAVPIFSLADIPEANTEEDPDTHERVPLRQLIRSGKARDDFYLPPFPGQQEEHYAELRKITSVGIQYFMDARAERSATLTPESLNAMYSHLLWSLTRAELFFRPVRCECGREVPIDIRFHGQNFDAEPWE
ncbi:MAG TPA: hypothetical protein VNZ56_17190 [Verrucomicrobiae bacterium]|jgi:hypothetical protein|nr:hypothetical protein [Verrucomicrobiae bacterium]